MLEKISKKLVTKTERQEEDKQEGVVRKKEVEGNTGDGEKGRGA